MAKSSFYKETINTEIPSSTVYFEKAKDLNSKAKLASANGNIEESNLLKLDAVRFRRMAYMLGAA